MVTKKTNQWCGASPVHISLSHVSYVLHDIRAVYEYEPLVTTEGSNEELGETHGTSQHDSLILRKREGDTVPLSFWETVETAFAFCWLWFIANWAANASLNYTTVASSTVIASTSGTTLSFCTPEMEMRLFMLGRFLYTWDRSALWCREVHDAKIDGRVHEVTTLVFLNRSTSPQSLP